MTFQKTVSLSLVSVLLASCSLVPHYTKPSVTPPQRWVAETKDAEGHEIPAAWWTVFGDDTLNALIADAGAQNLDLKIGVERVNQSRAALRIAGASLLPSANATASAARNSTNPVHSDTTTANATSAGLSIAYDLDLFGANRATNEAARATLKSAEYTHKALELATYSDVTEAYFNLLLTKKRIEIAQQNLKTSQELLRIVEARVKAGVDSNLELSQQKVAVSNTEASLAVLSQTESAYRNALAILLGKLPEDFAKTTVLTAEGLQKLVVPTIATGQPSTLLERRPDIASVEQSLIAANANIGVARAAYFPSITLGLTATATGTGLTNPYGTALGIASSLTAPIFEGGRLEGGVEKATSQQRELVATYQKSVLNAFGEVENALAAVKSASDREDSLKTAVEEAQKAYDISRKRYDVGTIDFATLLDTQASLLAAQDNFAQAMKARLSASLDLVKALGGGWKKA